MDLDILVVEDNPNMRMIIKRILSKIGFETELIYEAVNGKKGLEIIKNQQVDLLLTDINMPVMGGLEMLGHIRSHPDFREMPAIVISSKSDEKIVSALSKSGIGFLPKPFTLQGLQNQISSLEGCPYEAGVPASSA